MTAAEEAGSTAGQVARMAVNEVGRDLAVAGQLTEHAVAGLGYAVPGLISWLFGQAGHVGKAALHGLTDAIADVGEHAIDTASEWSTEAVKHHRPAKADNSLVQHLADDVNHDLLFGPAMRLMQGLTHAERLRSYAEDVQSLGKTILNWTLRKVLEV